MRPPAIDRKAIDLRRRLTAFLERRIPRWVDALAATDDERPGAVRRPLQIDAAEGEHIPAVVLLAPVASGYRVIESETRAWADAYGYSADDLWPTWICCAVRSSI